jgi:hypothetical protein
MSFYSQPSAVSRREHVRLTIKPKNRGKLNRDGIAYLGRETAGKLNRMEATVAEIVQVEFTPRTWNPQARSS